MTLIYVALAWFCWEADRNSDWSKPYKAPTTPGMTTKGWTDE